MVNNYLNESNGLKATAEIYNLDGTQKFSQQTNVDAAPNSSTRVLTLPAPEGLSPTYFVRLALADDKGQTWSRNFYWLSTQAETMGEPKDGSDWYYTPTRQFADFTALSNLPPAELRVSARAPADDLTTHVSLVNTGRMPAFVVRLKATDGKGEEILPALWEDNYISLLPGEQRVIQASCARERPPKVEVEGWNVAPHSKVAISPEIY